MDRRARQALLERLTRDAERIAAAFGLRFASIEAERANVKRRYGVCYADGSIRIRLRHAVTGRPLLYSSLVNTLCHELAHLRYFNHGKRFQAFYRRLLVYARAQGIYRPRAVRPAALQPVAALSAAAGSVARAPRRTRRRRRAAAVPEQLTLFQETV